MKGNAKVLEYLNFLLAGELAARDQYFIHASMYEEWGYKKLAELVKHEMSEETDHAQQIISRILFLEDTPKMVPSPLNIGADVKAMLESDYALELKVRDDLKKGIKICESEQDYVTRDMLLKQLQDTEEDHARWLEQHLHHIEQMGLELYLQNQLGE